MISQLKASEMNIPLLKMYENFQFLQFKNDQIVFVELYKVKIQNFTNFEISITEF